MFDFDIKDPLTWMAIGIPLVIYAAIVIAIWEGLKWLIQTF